MERFNLAQILGKFFPWNVKVMWKPILQEFVAKMWARAMAGKIAISLEVSRESAHDSRREVLKKFSVPVAMQEQRAAGELPRRCQTTLLSK